MNKTKIEWCDITWNPVTGCLHGCEYCYARGIASRFAAKETPNPDSLFSSLYRADGLCELGEPVRNHSGAIHPFPNGFAPTFHSYRLNEPVKFKRAQNIFVCSMADLFGDWVPDEWIEAVFKACEAAPQHRYLFLTKNPHAYCDHEIPVKSNYWYGQSDDGRCALTDYREYGINTFLSVEPLRAKPPIEIFNWFKWIIVGAETGNRKDKVIPKREWVENIVEQCRAAGVPVFMKNSLKEIWGEPLIQEYP